MPKINVYLPDDLADSVKELNLPVSSICQKALEQAVRKVGRAQSRRGGGIFRRFTPEAQLTVAGAEAQARALNHNYIGTEHQLLALTSAPETRVAKALAALGLTHEGVRSAVLEIIGLGETTPEGHISYTPRSKKVLELSLRRSLTDGAATIGEEHLLFALLHEGEGVAAQILKTHGITIDSLKSQLALQLVTPAAEDDEPVDEAEISVVPIVEMRIQELRQELNEEFERLHKRFEQERQASQALRDLLAQHRVPPVEQVPRAEPKEQSRNNKRDELQCTFCGKRAGEVEKLIAGPGVYICNECIDLCNEIVAEGIGPQDPDDPSV